VSVTTPPLPPPPLHHRDNPGRYASADLKAEPTAARRARRLTQDALTRWHLGHLGDEAQAVASELAANALDAATEQRGALPAIIFGVHHRPGQLRITVWDNGPGHPRQTHPGPDAETGRGLTIIDTLTGHNWGWWPTPVSGGKVVWAALPAPAADGPGPQVTPC
jgi:anti-sigma regulatory factor (Ser/Thr protein kinase)